MSSPVSGIDALLLPVVQRRRYRRSQQQYRVYFSSGFGRDVNDMGISCGRIPGRMDCCPISNMSVDMHRPMSSLFDVALSTEDAS